MASQVHTVVQNARDFDGLPSYDPVQQQMTSASASSVPGHVERPNALQNIIT
jgi:hypothetical protein